MELSPKDSARAYVREENRAKMAEKTLKISLWDDSENEEIEHELPAKHAVCSRCDGYGTHLNPSIGQHAFTPEEFNESFSEPEEREEYFKRGGIYDVACEECGGARVVLVVDVKATKAAGLGPILKQWRAQERARMQSEADDRRTQWMESGGRDC